MLALSTPLDLHAGTAVTLLQRLKGVVNPIIMSIFSGETLRTRMLTLHVVLKQVSTN